MTLYETRSFRSDLEVRSDGRTIVGLAVPFDAPAVVESPAQGGPFTETFRKGSFERTIRERGAKGVKAYVMHDRSRLPIGRSTLLREDARGLYAEIHVSKVAQGDEVLALVRDGAMDAFSIGFAAVPKGDRWNTTRGARTVERMEVALKEISIVDFPVYEGAGIEGVRSLSLSTLEVDRARLALLRTRF